ncbi:membrane fusion protein, multidrug efflux system [Loktanella sp. DSM 29012]|uniref:efflux RND transporter periplasmic adaptor subunit n=1 Tax=Loktanella sp. DSM 29012 TaxID=1881056 RepID=UPI0008AB919F|nr:efflux RND transporter periplasmic adaptor subunit [Loktanella sp. DSM 29012]SEQ07471.1 membrane fusion protein, multidrug efflux system [Loktanella sp. DSM 29012]
MGRVFKVLFGLCVVAACAAAGLWGTQVLLSGEAEAGGPPPQSKAAVGVTRPQTQTIDDAITAVGTLMPLRTVALTPTVPGRVTAVPVSSGDQVATGDLLIQLDERAARATLAEAEASLAETSQELARVDELADRNTAAETRLESARAAYARAEAAVMQARAALEDLSITAPFAGTLGLIDVEPGAVLDGSMPVTDLSDLSVVQVSASLPERYYERVAPGQGVTITTPAYPDASFEGEVTVRAPQIDLATRSFTIRAEIPNPDGQLVGGMFADARLVFDTYDGLAIPDDAIISEGLTTYVYVARDSAAVRTDVVVGSSLGALTEVREGLSQDDEVVISGWDNLTDGAPVEIVDDAAAVTEE